MKLIYTPSIIIFFFTLLTGCTETRKDQEKPATSKTPVTVESSVNLLMTYWKLVELKGKKVTDYPTQNHAPYIHLREHNELQGTGGCNSMIGQYHLKGENGIVFTQVIATEMACQGMELESDFYPFLSLISSYVIIDSTMTLSNQDGSASAKFLASDSK